MQCWCLLRWENAITIFPFLSFTRAYLLHVKESDLEHTVITGQLWRGVRGGRAEGTRLERSAWPFLGCLRRF